MYRAIGISLFAAGLLGTMFVWAFMRESIQYDRAMHQGQSAFQHGDYTQAIRFYSEAIRLRPGNKDDLNFMRGMAYGKNGDLENAIADFTAAIQRKPNDGMAFYNRGIIYALKDEPVKAEEDLLQAKKLGCTIRRSGEQAIAKPSA
jgi:Flp pilus assembly protein TadD